ncbi:OmpA family protein [Lysobacter yananisis]|uniref:OmpA family protein n=1 Tax=Lysobacter yananisis TaxID=1003114 RepID=A0ABY9PDY9_9GAMM|nr:OmpA family protein [Lysobacter yananisis]WMT04062.1 OmpA family protein [Lysobacter yananisis]
MRGRTFFPSPARALPAIVLAAALASLACAASAQDAVPAAAPAPASASAAAKPVIASGKVPDESSKQAVLAKLRELYGNERVIDRIEVSSGIVTPPNWRQNVVNMLGPDLQQVSDGKLEVNGNAVRVSGNVANELQRQQIVSGLSTRINNPTYSVDGRLLRVAGGAQQSLLDNVLANRIVEFESGSATLTPKGELILDEMAAAMKRIGNKRVLIVGHTDAAGRRESNLALSLARADSVKRYLQAHGVNGALLGVQGAGPDQPVADNATAEGRARNRRIAFKVL